MSELSRMEAVDSGHQALRSAIEGGKEESAMFGFIFHLSVSLFQDDNLFGDEVFWWNSIFILPNYQTFVTILI